VQVEGATETVTIEVTDRDTAIALGSGDVAVLATPRLVALVEAAAVAAVRPHLAPGTTTVGTHIALDHLAPSPVGATVSATAHLAAVAGRRLTFAVEARMGATLVASGSHVRAIVERSRFPQPPEL
jgi:predicted thioesterase